MIDVLNKGISAALRSNLTLMGMLSGGSAVYFHQAPIKAVKPYVVYIHAGGGFDHLTQEASGDTVYYIKGISDSDRLSGQIAQAIHDTLHENEGTFNLTPPWEMYRSQADAIIAYSETIEGKQVWHMGNAYRFRLSE